MIGAGSLYLAAAAIAAYFILYGLGGKYRSAAPWAYRLHVLAVSLASVFLLYILLTHRFQYHYVYSHTCRSLSWPYLAAAFWAGQEGSYLFWTLCSAVIGLFMLKPSREQSLPVFALGQLFLMILLLQARPFQLMSVLPANGSGLNPLLLDPWMIIHPPVIFLGYALLMVPMAASLSGLIRGSYREIKESLPWAVLGWFFLGAGIFLGGVWAYKVLGWGGYWSWDPVENSSLIPWLTASALVHGLLWQKRQGSGVRGNHLLAISTWVLILLAAFLTRSGVMSDYSVHAFAHTPLTGVLGAFLLVFALGGLGVFLWRFRDISDHSGEVTPFTQEGRFLLARWVLWAGAVLILLGTLSPLLTGLFGSPASVEQSFYYRTMSPLAWLLLVLMGFASANPRDANRALYIMPLAVLLGIFGGINSFSALIFLAAAAFALGANFLTLLAVIRGRGLKYSGAYLAHLGLALMLAGVLVSTAYTQGEIVQLVPGEQSLVLGYQMELMPLEGDSFTLSVQGRGRARWATPRIYNVGGQVMRDPAILRYLGHDLYISPLETGYKYPDQLTLGLGRFAGFGDYSLHFSEFSFGDHQAGGELEIGAVIGVRIMGAAYTITPKLKRSSQGYESIGVPLPESNYTVYLRQVEPAQELIIITIGPELSPGEKTLYVDVKKKPLISLLLLGTILVMAGTAVAVWRRLGEK